jgi:soluble lytic murein transglycosylase-like protein
MHTRIICPALISLLAATAAAPVAFGNDDPALPAAAPAAKAKLASKPRHYLPSPDTGANYSQTAATEAAIAGRLPKINVAPAARITPTAATYPAYSNADRYVAPLETRMSLNRSLKGYSTGSDLIDTFIVDSSRRYSIDPLLIYSQMGQESSFKLRALSNKGASGLMQLMPFTARRMGVTNIYDPQQNIEGGVKYMRLLMNMFDNDVVLALAGYNAGEGAVIKYGYRVPPYKETIDYVRRITARYRAITGR